MSGQAIIETKDLTKNYGTFTAVDHLNLSIEEGDIFGFLGPNGAGKTTLLHVIAGALKGDSGEIFHDGRKIDTGSLQWRRTLAYVLDDGGVIPLLTVEEQIYLQSVLTGVERSESGERTRRVIDLLELYKYREYRGDELSAGVRKRLGIGLGIVRDADVFLFDEPYSSLDLQGAAVFDRILEALKSSGRIVLVASHSFPSPAGLYNRLWSLAAGVIVDRANEREVHDRLDKPAPSGGLSGHGEIDLPWIVQST